MSSREIDYAARREYGRQVIQAGVSAFNNAKHPTMHQSILNWVHGSISDTALIRGMPPVVRELRRELGITGTMTAIGFQTAAEQIINRAQYYS